MRVPTGQSGILRKLLGTFPCFFSPQWVLSQVAVFADPDLVRITPLYEPSAAAEWFQVWITYVQHLRMLCRLMVTLLGSLLKGFPSVRAGAIWAGGFLGRSMVKQQVLELDRVFKGFLVCARLKHGGGGGGWIHISTSCQSVDVETLLLPEKGICLRRYCS